MAKVEVRISTTHGFHYASLEVPDDELRGEFHHVLETQLVPVAAYALAKYRRSEGEPEKP